MQEEEVGKGIGEMLRQGLGLFGQGVSAVAQVLRSGDAAVREVDGALTGGVARPPQGLSPANEEQVTHQVAALVRQGREEAARSGDPTAPGVMARFREAMRLLFQLPLPAASTGLSDIMPSPMEAVTMGLRDMRGSMALVRLANGTGSLADVEEVARFAEDVAGRLQEGAQAISRPPTPEPAPQAAAAQGTVSRKPPRGRATKGKHALSKAEGKSQGNPSAAAFARAMAEEMGDDQVNGWAEEFAGGKITEATWLSRLTEHAAETRESLDDVLERAQRRMQGKSGG